MRNACRLLGISVEAYKAFVVDDDCADDESELGLGTNARITYVDERRTGSVENPKEFAEIHGVKEQWKKF